MEGTSLLWPHQCEHITTMTLLRITARSSGPTAKQNDFVKLLPLQGMCMPPHTQECLHPKSWRLAAEEAGYRFESRNFFSKRPSGCHQSVKRLTHSFIPAMDFPASQRSCTSLENAGVIYLVLFRSAALFVHNEGVLRSGRPETARHSQAANPP